jgi:hypothetical protein
MKNQMTSNLSKLFLNFSPKTFKTFQFLKVVVFLFLKKNGLFAVVIFYLYIYIYIDKNKINLFNLV